MRKLHYSMRLKDQIVQALKEELATSTNKSVELGPAESSESIGEPKQQFSAKISQLFEKDAMNDAASRQ